MALAIAMRWLAPHGLPITPPADTSVAGLAWLMEVDGWTGEIAPLVSETIRSGAGDEASRMELFRQVIGYEASPVPKSRKGPRHDLLLEWMEHEDEFR